MTSAARLLAAAAATATLLAASAAGAANYSLWIHGRNSSQSTQPGNYADFSYWGSSGTSAGVNKKAVNWDGYSHVSDKNYLIRNALDCYWLAKVLDKPDEGKAALKKVADLKLPMPLQP